MPETRDPQKPKKQTTIYLIGFMAAGKSTVGRLLAGRLAVPWIDLDSMITKREGATISEIFSERGEHYFRKTETAELRNIQAAAGFRGAVVSTGGGAPCSSENLSLMKRTGIVIYLKVRARELLRRIGEGSSRPVFMEMKQHGIMRARVKKLLKSREPFYNQAHITVRNSRNRDPGEIVEYITRKVTAGWTQPPYP
jgi:shikimate kinase